MKKMECMTLNPARKYRFSATVTGKFLDIKHYEVQSIDTKVEKGNVWCDIKFMVTIEQVNKTESDVVTTIQSFENSHTVTIKLLDEKGRVFQCKTISDAMIAGYSSNLDYASNETYSFIVKFVAPIGKVTLAPDDNSEVI